MPVPARSRRRCRARRPRARDPRGGGPHARHLVLERARRLVEVPRLQPPLDPRQDRPRRRGSRHSPSSRRAAAPAHAAEAGREDRPPGEVGRAEVPLPRSGEGLVGALQDPLGADVDPAPGRHLPEHRQPCRLEPAELVPGRPPRHEQRVRDQHPRRTLVRAEHADRLAALHEQRLVVAEPQERAHDRLQRVVRARRGRSRRRRRAPRAARPPPESRLLRSIRSGASVCHERAFSCGPRGARIAERSPASASTCASSEETLTAVPTAASAAAGTEPFRDRDGDAFDVLRERPVVSTRSDSSRTASSGPHARPRLERREELDRLRPGEQLDREHAPPFASTCSAFNRRRCPSRRDPPDPRSSGSSRRSPGGRATCSPRRARRDVLRDHEAAVEPAFEGQERRAGPRTATG